MTSTRRRLVLASASPARLRLLTQAGFAPAVVVSGVDEEALAVAVAEGGEIDVGRIVCALATAKAAVVAARPEVAGAVVVACDSLLDVDGEALGKPATPAEAHARLSRLRGRSAVLRTGHCLIDTATGAQAAAAAATEVHFGSPTDDELAAYVASGEPLRVAGAFTLDGRFGPFVEGITGDHGTVVGLSLPLFRRLLAELDLTVMDLWA